MWVLARGGLLLEVGFLSPQGKVYYYHTITRKSQWDQPTEVDAEGTITMDLGTPEHEHSEEEVRSCQPSVLAAAGVRNSLASLP